MAMRHAPAFAVLDAPSHLGLKTTGVERLAGALRAERIVERLSATDAGRVSLPALDPARDPDTGVLNGPAIRDYARQLADAVAPLVRAGQFPVVLGGDCSILLGAMLALRWLGRYGLAHVDGHADFYQPEAEPNGEVASMDLALVTGHGPELLTDIEGRRPYVRDEDAVQFASRDADEAAEYGSQDIRAVSAVAVYDLAAVRALGVDEAFAQASPRLVQNDLAGFWIHLDADVLDDAIMPAVDARLPDGLRYEDMRAVLRLLLGTGRAVGMTVTIFNPAMDADGSIARAFTTAVVDALTDGTNPGSGGL